MSSLPKVVILCGGKGTRIREKNNVVPKPLVEIGRMPIVWHIIQYYRAFGFTEFVLALGYKGHLITEWFKSMDAMTNMLGCTVECVPTGDESMTGGRIYSLYKQGVIGLLGEFALTYGDGLTNAHPLDVLNFHNNSRYLVTLLAVHPPARFGKVELTYDGEVTRFTEKSSLDTGWINGGFMIMSGAAIPMIKNENTVLEREPLERLASDGLLGGHRHSGFWACMDTLRDWEVLEELWNSGNAPWKVW